jgi:hypothetical protein
LERDLSTTLPKKRGLKTFYPQGDSVLLPGISVLPKTAHC